MANAIFWDAGWVLAGGEGDWGKVFMLSGAQIGSIYGYDEFGGGVGFEISFGFELGRLDVTGDQNLVEFNDFLGARNKVWVSGIGIGGSYTWGSSRGEKVYGSAIQLGISFNPFFSPITGGWNTGIIYPKR